MDELIYASATTLAQAIQAKKVSSEEVVKAHLERIEAVNPKLNAIVYLAADAALAQARAADAALARGEITGVLHGVPVTIKDAWETAGIASTGGTAGRARYVPTTDATVVARARATGSIILGMTNLPELSLAFESDNLIHGRTNNPYDMTRTPGGSGGGGAAIIAAGGSPWEIGADAGGSIRLPSHFCGIAGIKPTTGRVPLTGYFPPLVGFFGQITAAGPMARRVEDLILTLPVLTGVDWRDPEIIPVPLRDPRAVHLKGLRVAFHTDNGIQSPTPETVEVVKTAAKALSDAGLVVEEARPQGIEQSFEIFFGLVSADGGAGVQMLLQMAGTTEPHPRLRQLLETLRPSAISTAELAGLWARWDMFRSTMLSFLETYDAILCPVCAEPAMPHGTTFERLQAFGYTMAYNLTGWPGVVVRGGTSPEGLPIGVQVVARPWREDVALAVAQHIETALGGWQGPPL